MKVIFKRNEYFSFDFIFNIVKENRNKRTIYGILKSKYNKWVGFDYITKNRKLKNVSEESMLLLATNFWFFNQDDFKERFSEEIKIFNNFNNN